VQLVVRLLGREVLAVETGPDAPRSPGYAEEVPFGFHGGSGGLVERAEPWPVDEVNRGRRP
jgi:hypothetical protein